METDFKVLANKVINVNGLPSKKKIIVFSFCLFISLFFWMLIKFTKVFHLTVLCPVTFVNLPKDKVLMDNADTTFLITIKSEGYNLLYYQLFKKKTRLRIDASLLKFNSVQNDTISNLSTSQITKLANNQFNFDYEIVSVFPETYALHWEKAYMKKVPVKLNLTINYTKQYQLYDTIRIEPDTINISGTKSELAQINYLYTNKVNLQNISQSQDIVVDVFKPLNFPKIKLNASKIKITIPVEKYTEAEIDIPVIVSDNETNNIKLFPEKVRVTYQVALKDFKKVNQEMFLAVTNINKDKTNKDYNAKVDIIKSPSFIKISKIYPEKLEYIILK